jgi:hypothetical protein
MYFEHINILYRSVSFKQVCLRKRLIHFATNIISRATLEALSCLIALKWSTLLKCYFLRLNISGMACLSLLRFHLRVEQLTIPVG